MLEGLKVITSNEMARIEKLACDQGASELAFMEKAGDGIADAVEDYLEANHLVKEVTLLVGKGNNGGDAFAAGAKLIERGIRTKAIHIFPLDVCSPLCKMMHEKFRSHQGQISHEFHFGKEGVILDGLVGTGFRGKAEGILGEAIEQANQSGLPIIAVDIPSGLNGTTGEVGSIAIHAVETIFLEMPKSGFFLKDGWDHVGKLTHVSFGLGKKYIEEADPVAYLFNEDNVPLLFPPINRTRHKYQAGYVLAVAGSPGMPGAAIMSSFSALRAGAGIVRLFHPQGMEAQLSGAPYELIHEGWDGKKLNRIQKEAERAKAMLIGPGIGRTKAQKKMVQQLLKKIDLPMVIDADALFFLAENPSWKLPKGSILTPHRGEMNLILHKKKENGLMEACQAYADTKKTTIVLKGAPTIIFHPGETPLIMTMGDPGMATAGSGDVLTGVVAGMLAQGLAPRHAAALSVYLHGKSGEAAAERLTSYCMTASDLIDFLPEAFLDGLL